MGAAAWAVVAGLEGAGRPVDVVGIGRGGAAVGEAEAEDAAAGEAGDDALDCVDVEVGLVGDEGVARVHVGSFVVGVVGHGEENPFVCVGQVYFPDAALCFVAHVFAGGVRGWGLGARSVLSSAVLLLGHVRGVGDEGEDEEGH